MEKLPLISVIVPVYRVEAYLDKCISSIVNQTYQNLEIILVDDGSPDNCPAMCDAWAEKDSRIRVIHQENQGGGAARNAGLDAASGELIAFVDSDDYISLDMYEIMLTILRKTNASIVECSYMAVEDDCPLLSAHATIKMYSTEDALYANLYNTACQQVIWNKLYRKKTIGTIRFVAGKTIDDEYFTYRVIGNAKNVAVISDILYFYRQHDGSVMHQNYSLKRLDAVAACIERCNYLSNYYPALTSDAKINLWITCMFHYQMALCSLHDNDKRKAIQLLLEAIKSHRLCRKDLKTAHESTRLWLLLGKLNFSLVCRIRNLLQVGL